LASSKILVKIRH